METQGLRCRGLGKSVQGRVAFRGQSAAHDQITERNLSIAWLRISLAGASNSGVKLLDFATHFGTPEVVPFHETNYETHPWKFMKHALEICQRVYLSDPLRAPMLTAFVAIERVLYGFCRHIRYQFEPLHEGLRPRAIRASPICRCLCRTQDCSRSFRHTPNSTLISITSPVWRISSCAPALGKRKLGGDAQPFSPFASDTTAAFRSSSLKTGGDPALKAA
jgi:hypothetical protein